MVYNHHSDRAKAGGQAMLCSKWHAKFKASLKAQLLQLLYGCCHDWHLFSSTSNV